MNRKQSRHRISTLDSIVWTENTMLVALLFATASVAAPVTATARVYSIFEIQYTTEPDGRSPLEGQVVDCLGGVVTHKFAGGKPKLTLQDPDHPSAWGAIQVKDGLAGAPLFHEVSIGDWVTLSNVYVEEFRGNTTLQCLPDNNPTLTIVSRDNPLPEPLVVTPEQIASPVEDPLGDWYVATHEAEKYEHMRLRVVKVVVGAMNLGKAADNYVLQSIPDSNESPASCWATDYMNADTTDDYHPYVSAGQRFCRVEGILEQYTNTREGWDYYQLVTTGTRDLSVSQTADLDDDCDVDFLDFGLFAEGWLADCTAEAGSCGRADLDEDRSVRIDDLAQLAEHWLDGRFVKNRGDHDGPPDKLE